MPELTLHQAATATDPTRVGHSESGRPTGHARGVASSGAREQADQSGGVRSGQGRPRDSSPARGEPLAGAGPESPDRTGHAGLSRGAVDRSPFASFRSTGTVDATGRPDDWGRESTTTESTARGGGSGRGHRSPVEDVLSPESDLPPFSADVDRVVEKLYREVERRMRIERERRGL